MDTSLLPLDDFAKRALDASIKKRYPNAKNNIFEHTDGISLNSTLTELMVEKNGKKSPIHILSIWWRGEEDAWEKIQESIDDALETFSRLEDLPNGHSRLREEEFVSEQLSNLVDFTKDTTIFNLNKKLHNAAKRLLYEHDSLMDTLRWINESPIENVKLEIEQTPEIGSVQFSLA